MFERPILRFSRRVRSDLRVDRGPQQHWTAQQEKQRSSVLSKTANLNNFTAPRPPVARTALTAHHESFNYTKHKVLDNTPGSVYTSTVVPTPATQVNLMTTSGEEEIVSTGEEEGGQPS